MKTAAIYDVHGNLPALCVVLAEIVDLGVERLVVGGDVLPGPMPSASLFALLGTDIPTHFIQGNGERDVLALRAGKAISVPAPFLEMMRWVGGELTSDHVRQILGWPTTVTLEFPSLGKVQFCHATPQSMDAVFTERTPAERIASAFEGVDASVVVCGHTHIPFERDIAGRRVINAGSVGMPYGSPGAHWLLIDDDVEFRCSTYDCAQAAEAIRATRFPGAGAFADEHVNSVPDKQAMLERFERAALRFFPPLHQADDAARA